MRYRNAIIIDAEPERVWQIFDDPETARDWQPTLKSHRLVSGVEGEVGCVYSLVYDNDGRDIDATATLTAKREFDLMSSTIDSESSLATVVNRFESAGEHQTRWDFDIHYQFKGLYWFVSLFLRGTMRKRAADEMQRFKQLVERR